MHLKLALKKKMNVSSSSHDLHECTRLVFTSLLIREQRHNTQTTKEMVPDCCFNLKSKI